MTYGDHLRRGCVPQFKPKIDVPLPVVPCTRVPPDPARTTPVFT